MKIAKIGLLLLSALLVQATVIAQTADEIINKHITAMGGKEKINGIKSMYLESTIDIMGNEAPSTTYVLNGKGFKNEVEFNGTKIVQAVTDKSGWMINPMMGATTAQAIPEEQVKYMKSQIFAGGPLFDYAARGSKVELQGKEGNNYKLKVTSNENTESIYYIDPATYYITRSVVTGNMQGQQMQITTSYSDYKKTDYGFVVPMKTDTDLGQFQLASTIKKVEINKEIDPAIFEMPK